MVISTYVHHHIKGDWDDTANTPRRLGANIDHAPHMTSQTSSLSGSARGCSHLRTGGSDQITCHIRSDRRHIQDADLPRLRDVVQTQLNVEMVTEEMMALVIPILQFTLGDTESRWFQKEKEKLRPKVD